MNEKKSLQNKLRMRNKLLRERDVNSNSLLKGFLQKSRLSTVNWTLLLRAI